MISGYSFLLKLLLLVFFGHSWLGFFSSVLDQSVDVMLGAVLRRRDLEHEGDAEERLLGVAVCHSLERRSQE